MFAVFTPGYFYCFHLDKYSCRPYSRAISEFVGSIQVLRAHRSPSHVVSAPFAATPVSNLLRNHMCPLQPIISMMSATTRSTSPPPPTPIIEQLPAKILHLEPDGSNWAIVFAVHLREAIRAYRRWSYFESSTALPGPAVPQNITAAVERL